MKLIGLRTTWWLVFLVYSVKIVSAEESCYGAGAIATSVVLSVLITLIIFGAVLYWIRRKPKSEHLILETDPEKGKSEYAFDNPGFKEAGLTPLSKSLEKSTSKFEAQKNGKQKWNHWTGLSTLAIKSEKRKTLDDSVVDGNEVKVVALRSHDFTGLGFSICGNMKDGIYIKDILHRGPASESGKLNPGDRINSVTIGFEHIVYEDALTILSYASPYEVMIEAKSGKTQIGSSSKSNHPIHPIFRSSSSTDLQHVGKSARRKLHSENSSSSNYLHKSMSNMTTLERKCTKSPRPSQIHSEVTENNTLNSEQLKNKLEQRISSAETEAKIKSQESGRIEMETQKTENKYQKFGIKVFPTDQQKSPKTSELSQNDNNINIEKNKIHVGLDEPDTTTPKAEKRKMKTKECSEKKEKYFERNNSINSSGLKRDSNGIPQELPSHMLNAAIAARRNRKSPDEISTNDEDVKTPKKLKGKAPPPPPEEKGKESEKPNISSISPDLYEIKQVLEDTKELSIVSSTPVAMETSSSKKDSLKGYNSESDDEIDNQSSVNTIELNSSDITIHNQESEEIQNRKTASTGDLTKIHRYRKSSSGTLERAQSLDITDTGIPTLTKKMKGGIIEDTFDMKSDEIYFGKAMLNEEPKLSSILNGLNTFQRNKLKKSTEWGNLEDAIKASSQDEGSNSPVFDQNISSENLRFNFERKSAELDALVNRINEIRRESQQIDKVPSEETTVVNAICQIPKNQLWPTETETPIEIEPMPPIKIRSKTSTIVAQSISTKSKMNTQNEIWPKELEPNSKDKLNYEEYGENEKLYEAKYTTEPLEQKNNDRKDGEVTIKLKGITDMQPLVVDENEQNKQEMMDQACNKTTASNNIENYSSSKEGIEIKTVNKDSIPQVEREEQEIVDIKRAIVNIQKENGLPIRNTNLVETINATAVTGNMIESETPPDTILNIYETKEIIQNNSEDLTDVELRTSNCDIPSRSKMEKKEVLPNRVVLSPDKMKIQKRQQIPNGEDEILPPPEISGSNLEQEIFEELRRNHSSPESSEIQIANNENLVSETSNNLLRSDEFLYRTDEKYPKAKRNSETGEICTEMNNTDESKTTFSEINPRYFNSSESFISNERYLCSEDRAYQVLPEDTNVPDDIKVSRHSLGSLERPKSDDAKSIESLKYLSNVSNVTINSVQTENTSSLHSLEFSVNEPSEEINQSRVSDNSELYTTALSKTVKPEKDLSKVNMSTPDLIKNVSITEAINTLNSDMDQHSSFNFDKENKLDMNHTFNVDNSSTNGINDASKQNGTTSDNISTKNHSSLTYITEIQVTPNNTNSSISEIEIVPFANVELEQYSRNLDNEFENYVKNFEVKNLDTNRDVKLKNVEMKKVNDIVIQTKIDPEKELHKIQEIAQEQLKKLPEMRFSTSSYESPSRIPEKRQSQIELLKSNFEKSPPRSLKSEIATKSRIPISMTMKTPPTSPERRDSRNLEMENENEILELMSSTVHSTPMTNSLKYQKSSNKNVTITSIRNNSKIPSGLPVLGGIKPPIPPKKSEQENESVQFSSNNSNINSFKQWVFDPVDSVTNISLTGLKQEHT